MNRAYFFALTMLLACGSKPPPAPKPEPTAETPPPPPLPVDAGPAVDAEPPEAAPPPEAGKEVALCSVPTDPSGAQCLTWRGCAGGIVETHAGKPIRKCAATVEQCEGAEAKLTSELEKLKAAQGEGRVCKLRMYLRKEIKIDDAKVLVCPEDADDRALSELWRQIAATCKEPIGS